MNSNLKLEECNYEEEKRNDRSTFVYGSFYAPCIGDGC